MSRGAKRYTGRIIVLLDPPALEKLRWLAEHDQRDMSSTVRHLIAVAYGKAAHTDEPPQPKNAPGDPTP